MQFNTLSRAVGLFSSMSAALAFRRWRGREESESGTSSWDLSSRERRREIMAGVLVRSAFPL
jgi:hypothetical protein